MIITVTRESSLCRQCQECEGHLPGITGRLRGNDSFTMDEAEYFMFQDQLEWVEIHCPEGAITVEVA